MPFHFSAVLFRHKNSDGSFIIKRVMEMPEVIYADVLVIINFYVTYFLLLSAVLLSKQQVSRLRLLFSSFLGGFYSLGILILPEYKLICVLIKIGAAILPVMITFGLKNPTAYLRAQLSFLLCSFLFAGLMFGLWYFISPSGMYFDGSVVYFDIDLLTLVVLTVLCYGFLKLFDLFFRSRASVNTVFLCDVLYCGKSYRLKAFLDTGNRLSDPFTGKPVIIARHSVFESALSGTAGQKLKVRFIPCVTVSGEGLLPVFNPERVKIKGAEYEFTTDAIMIALTKEKLLGGEYDAILPAGLFDNNFSGKDERESEKNIFDAQRYRRKTKAKAFSFTELLCKRLGKSSAAAYKGKGK